MLLGLLSYLLCVCVYTRCVRSLCQLVGSPGMLCLLCGVGSLVFFSVVTMEPPSLHGLLESCSTSCSLGPFRPLQLLPYAFSLSLSVRVCHSALRLCSRHVSDG